MSEVDLKQEMTCTHVRWFTYSIEYSALRHPLRPSQIDGTADKPITIQGVDKENVLVHGTGDQGRIFEIMHDFYILEVQFLGQDRGWGNVFFDNGE